MGELTKRDRHGRPVPVEPRFDAPMKRFEAKAGREHIMSLCDLQEDPKYGALAAFMTNPEYANWSFPAMAKAAGVTLHELQQMYNKAAVQEAIMAFSDALPIVAADIAEDARSTYSECERCFGSGEVDQPPPKELVSVSENGIAIPPDKKPCPACDGSGQIRKVGNKHARDLMFQSTGIISNGKMTVGMQQTLGADMDAGIEGILKATQAIVVKVGS